MKRPPAKSRRTVGFQHDKRRDEKRPATQQNDTFGYSAPSHMGGDFSEAGYSTGCGTFGFQQRALP